MRTSVQVLRPRLPPADPLCIVPPISWQINAQLEREREFSAQLQREAARTKAQLLEAMSSPAAAAAVPQQVSSLESLLQLER